MIFLIFCGIPWVLADLVCLGKREGANVQNGGGAGGIKGGAYLSMGSLGSITWKGSEWKRLGRVTHVMSLADLVG